MEKIEIPDGLRRAYMLVLAPAAFLAPLPLFWTGGARAPALAVYEAALLLLWWRARAGRAIRLSNTVLNAIGLSYLFWLGIEVMVVRPGLLRTVVHLLLFTAIAKLASLKHPGEARTALLVLFLLALSAASSSFHVSSLLYFGAMAWIGFRTLSRLAVLADFDVAPPDRVLGSIPTGGLAAAAMAGALLVGGPLFYALPRLRAPYAVAPFRLDEALATTLAADRVDLEAFSSAKKSDRVVLRFELDPELELPRVLRLREAVFTDYRDGSWLRGTLSAADGKLPPSPGVPRAAPSRVYMTGLVWAEAVHGAFARSDDGGKTFAITTLPGSDSGTQPYIAGLDPKRPEQFFTLYHPDYRVLIGYTFPSEGNPWLADWQENQRATTLPWNGKVIARGLEFGSSPFAEGLRKSVERGSLFGAPAYRWIGGKQRLGTEFSIFLEEIPEGFQGIHDVRTDTGVPVMTKRK